MDISKTFYHTDNIVRFSYISLWIILRPSFGASALSRFSHSHPPLFLSACRLPCVQVKERLCRNETEWRGMQWNGTGWDGTCNWHGLVSRECASVTCAGFSSWNQSGVYMLGTYAISKWPARKVTGNRVISAGNGKDTHRGCHLGNLET